MVCPCQGPEWSTLMTMCAIVTLTVVTMTCSEVAIIRGAVCESTLSVLWSINGVQDILWHESWKSKSEQAPAGHSSTSSKWMLLECPSSSFLLNLISSSFWSSFSSFLSSSRTCNYPMVLQESKNQWKIASSLFAINLLVTPYLHLL